MKHMNVYHTAAEILVYFTECVRCFFSFSSYDDTDVCDADGSGALRGSLICDVNALR